MKLDKAIEILDLYLHDCFITTTSDHAKAIKLGIGTLNRVKDMRISPCTTADELIPGETPETNSKRSLHHIKKVLESPLGREPKP